MNGDRTVLVTGGTAGIGRALVAELVSRGVTVITCGRDPDRLEALRRAHPTVDAIEADLATTDGVAHLADEITARHHRLDGLINNAGLNAWLGRVGDAPWADQAAAEIGVNLTAPILLTGTLLPLLNAGTNPFVVNVTSIAAAVPRPATPVYCAAKAGLRAYTASMRAALQPQGVRVIELIPPLVDTDMAARIPAAKMPPERFAAIAVDGIEAGRPVIVFGRNRRIVALARVAPRVAARLI